MPDISMCKGTGCSKRNNCYRYRAQPHPNRQSYFAKPPKKPDGRCDYYWSCKNYDPEYLEPIEEEKAE